MLLGFTIILTLLCVLIITSIHQLSRQLNYLNETSKSNHTLQNLFIMQDAVSQRSLYLYRMSTTQDPFVRDDIYLQYKHQAQRYLKAFNLLDTDKKIDVDSLKLIMQKANDSHNRVINLLATENFTKVSTLLISEIPQVQNALIDEITNYVNTLREKVDASITTATSENYLATSQATLIGGIIFILCVLITIYVLYQSKKAERIIIKQRQRAEDASQYKSSFLANMSHEIRTPLTAIIGFSESLQNDNLNINNQSNALETITRNGKHLQELINNILDMSKIEAGDLVIEHIKTSPVEIAEQVKSIVNPNATKKGIQFKVSYQYPIPSFITIDPTRLKQILINLCSNAIKFTHQGEVQLSLTYNKHDHSMRFIVKDSGIGMSQQAIEKIFLPFVQAEDTTSRNFGGSGLGLAISNQLARAMNGKLTCASEQQIGSEFELSLKLESTDKFDFTTEQQANEDQQSYKNDIVVPLLSGNILLAEDSVDNQQLISMYIEQTGANVKIVSNGEQAVEEGLANNYQLILMDMQMPKMDGVTATELLRASGYTHAIVSITANALQSDKDKCINAGANDYIVKPIDLKQFYKILKQYLTKAEATNKQEQAEKINLKIKKLAASFIQALPGKLSILTNAHRDNDWETLESASHKLKGLAGSFGFPEVTENAQQINELVRQKKYSEINEAIAQLLKQCEKILIENVNSTNDYDNKTKNAYRR